MKEIEDKLPSDDKDSIVSRESLSLLWPLSPSEFDAVDETMRKFDADYWLRDGGEFPLFWPTDVFLPGEGEEESAPPNRTRIILGLAIGVRLMAITEDTAIHMTVTPFAPPCM